MKKKKMMSKIFDVFLLQGKIFCRFVQQTVAFFPVKNQSFVFKGIFCREAKYGRTTI
jgi:hypothetical protein